MLENREALVAELTPLCTFPEIAEALASDARVPVSDVTFEKIVRKDRVMRPLTAWHRAAEDIAGQGWAFRIRFRGEGIGWAGRDFFRALDLIHIGHLFSVEKSGDGRTFGYFGVMFAEDFPAMWLAEKLTQGLTFGDDE